VETPKKILDMMYGDKWVTKSIEIFAGHFSLSPKILHPKNFDMNFSISRHFR